MNLLAVLSIPAPLPWAGCGSQASRAVQCRSSPSSGCEWCQGCLSMLTPPACAQGKHGRCHSEMGCARHCTDLALLLVTLGLCSSCLLFPVLRNNPGNAAQTPQPRFPSCPGADLWQWSGLAAVWSVGNYSILCLVKSLGLVVSWSSGCWVLEFAICS